MLSDQLKAIRLVEVGPRDGLQNEKKPISTEDKFTFIQKLVAAGHRNIEVTSFVKPSAIPQLSDARELVGMLNAADWPEDVTFSALVPNQRGLDAAMELGVKEIALFLAASDAFSQKNINATVDESFARVEPVAQAALDAGIKVRGYLSTVFGCPYEGDIGIPKVVDAARRLADLGVYEISLGDTTGVGTPLHVSHVLEEVLKYIPRHQLAMHFHDTRGMALANTVASLQMGIAHYDASAGGLGGCPYAAGASGNVATEDLVYLFHSMELETGINIPKLVEAADFMLDKVGVESPSKLHRILSQ